MTNLKRVKVCFTGHRPNALGGWDEDNPIKKKVCKVLSEEISRIISEHDMVEFICGGALGVDTWAAMEVLKYQVFNPKKIFLTLAIPHVGQQNNWNIEAQLKWLNIFRCADRVEFIDEEGYAVWKMMNRNKWMVKECDMVVAVWNGGDKGGTAQCVEFASKQHKNIVNLWNKL